MNKIRILKSNECPISNISLFNLGLLGICIFALLNGQCPGICAASAGASDEGWELWESVASLHLANVPLVENFALLPDLALPELAFHHFPNQWEVFAESSLHGDECHSQELGHEFGTLANFELVREFGLEAIELCQIGN